MYFCKENKPNYEKLLSCLSFEELKNTINALESIIQFIRNVEKSLKEIMNRNIELKNKVYKDNDIKVNNFEHSNKIIENIYSQGNNHIQEIEKIISNLQKYVVGDNFGYFHEEGGEEKNENFKNKYEITNEVEDIKSYFEGKINIMDKKIKVLEILESLYIKQIEELRNKLNKYVNNRPKKINEELIIYDFN